jgi:hypothetical protein
MKQLNESEAETLPGVYISILYITMISFCFI